MGRQEQRIKELVLTRVGKCGQCGVEYSLPDVNVLGHKEDLWFLMLVCGQCHQAVGVAAVVKEQGPSGELAAEGFTGIANPHEEDAPLRTTPLEAPPVEDNAQAASNSAPVTREDVTELHEFLQKFDGDFKRLFGERV